MKLQNTALAALLLLATCADGGKRANRQTIESARARLGKIPASEVAVWQKLGTNTSASGRYLQAAAFDEARKVVVMFGGITDPSAGTAGLSQETWEWSTTTGKWTNRTTTGTKPDPRSGAAMVYDSARAKFILFGGRAGSGFNLEDTWEWDPATGVWSDTGATGHPSGRSQHMMVFEKSTGMVLLFGGGRSTPTSGDGTGVTLSLGDTSEYNPTNKAWTARPATTSPSVRNDSAMVWDSSRNKVVLFGGIQIDIAGATGVPKQDVWEWDPTAATWTERTASGTRPSQRYAHAMAFDGTRKKVVLYGGWDMSTGFAKSDLWDWEPTTGVWTQRLIGTEAGIPSGRMYASMLADDDRDRMLIVGGAAVSGNSGVGGMGGFPYYPDAGVAVPVRLPDMIYAPNASREVWEVDPVTPAFTNRTPPLDAPTTRLNPAVAFNPVSGKTCLFGGSDQFSGTMLDDYWEWDGKTWTEVKTNGTKPPARDYAAMAFDPVRKSVILFGGVGYYSYSGSYNDTWELNAGGTWVQLTPATSPPALMGHGMVTDTTRNKILLFGGMQQTYGNGFPTFIMNSSQNQVWEWDGAAATWTNRTPISTTSVPTPREFPAMAYDEGRQKLVLFNGMNYGSSSSSFSEWDPLTGGWTNRDTVDSLDPTSNAVAAYDSVRRREVIVAGAYNMASGIQETWELDSVVPTWYVRSTPAAPSQAYGASMVCDSKRGVMVYIGAPNGMINNDSPVELWEYTVTGWGNGEGCTAATVSQCSSGNCVDGVCCESASCTGACKACNVPGSEGTCVLAKPGTEVAGSCDSGKACDGKGTCKAKNSTACSGDGDCASGFCVDGICCDSACDGTCASCNQPGHLGKCTPYQAGTDPLNECGQGDGVCKSTCDGAGHCAFPQYSVSCGNCMTCNGYGSCSIYDYKCGYIYDGGPPGIDLRPIVPDVSGFGGFPNLGGSGGYRPGVGGAGGYGGSPPYPVTDGAAGNSPRTDGAAGTTPQSLGGAGAFGFDGAAGSISPFIDGSADSIASTGGIFAIGGNGGGVVGSGGVGGSKPWGGGIIDGGIADAGVSPNLKSGCSCDLGQSQSSSGLQPLLAAAGLALLLVRRGRGRKGTGR